MKPIKDKFTIEQIKDSEKRIKESLIKFAEENNLEACWFTYSPYNISLTTKSINRNPTSTYQQSAEVRDIFANSFSIISEPNMEPTHNINIVDEQKFYKDVFSQYSKQDKIIFIKTISRHTDNSRTLSTINVTLPEEDYWLHLRNFTPFSKNTKQTYMFKDIMDTLSQKSIDNEDKAQALIQLFHYYKPIIKRVDTKNSVHRFIERNVEPEFQEHFEKFLNFKIGEEVDDEAYLTKSDKLIVLTMDKEQIFKSLPFKNYGQSDVQTYNNLITMIYQHIVNKQSTETGVEHIVFQEFSSKKNPAKLYIESKDDGFKIDIEKYFKLLMKVGVENIKPRANWEEMRKIFDNTLNYFNINNSLTKNDSTEDTIRTKKMLKI